VKGADGDSVEWGGLSKLVRDDDEEEEEARGSLSTFSRRCDGS
jgi:hypothetical protein